MPLDARNYYLIRASSGVSVLVRRGDGLPQITGGGARFNTINRPRRKSIVQWDGDDPYTMDVPVMFDGWSTGKYGMTSTSIEADVARVNQMRQSPGDLVPPVQVFVDGAVPVKGATWVITGIDWGTATIWQADKFGRGYRLRQDAVLHLLQYVAETDLKLNRMPAMTTRYRVKTQESLDHIAAQSGVSTSAIKIANGIRDGKTVKTNQILYIPPSLNQGKN
jgi:hypothetical protein